MTASSLPRLAGVTPALLTGLFLALIALSLSACQPGMAEAARVTPQAAVAEASAIPTAAAATPAAAGLNPSPTPAAQFTPTPSRAAPTSTSPASKQPFTPTSTPPDPVRLSPDEWKDWPVIPQVPLGARALYQQGLALGTNPHTFSILGDCQSLPESFLGVYDTDAALVASLAPELQAVVANFAGSFNRQSPTIKGGTTAGAVLWTAWHEEAFTCKANETPLDCELRLNNPSIVIINLGTHYETRNITYLRKILDQLVDRGIVPILATKADNRELDERLNQEMALLAAEYDVPLWNFFSAVSDLPNNGVGTKKGEEFLGEIYLSDEGLERHRFTALQALAAVWEAVK